MRPRDDPRVRLLAELADPTRFGILERLERGPLTATALAQHLDVSATQLANHLRRLREANLVSVQHESRLAVYQLAEPGLREIFSMLNGLRGQSAAPAQPPPEAARCYDHVAGQLGVALFDHLVTNDALEPREGEGRLALGPRAEEVFESLGVSAPLTHGRRMPAYACLDSTLRRPHLGGQLGARIATSLSSRGWIRTDGASRRFTLTPTGRAGLAKLGISIGDGADVGA